MEKKNIFGTDGVRGVANVFPMTPEFALKTGIAVGSFFSRGLYHQKAVIAKDTRLSGYMLEPALTAGFTSAGMDVFLVGPMPTPAVAMLTRSLRANVGIMISASHNPYLDNGIKLFDASGLKISDDVEIEITKRIFGINPMHMASPENLGRVKRLDDAPGRYIEYAKHTFPKGKNLKGIHIVLDCANGAAYHLAPDIFWELGAEVSAIGIHPDGFNINKDCGSTAPQIMCEEVVRKGADIGIAFDGDADRIVVCDERGCIIEGEKLLALIAKHKLDCGTLQGNGVVTSIMSNKALDEYLASLGLVLHRTQVGDRYIAQKMQELSCNVGGEKSGHVIMHDFSTTGDGIVAALQLLSILSEKKELASRVFHAFDLYPQLLKNVDCPMEHKHIVKHDVVKGAVKDAEKQLLGGRIVVRYSGTEPLIRIMGEGKDVYAVETALDHVTNTIQGIIDHMV